MYGNSVQVVGYWNMKYESHLLDLFEIETTFGIRFIAYLIIIY
jgi:hypothetical protein